MTEWEKFKAEQAAAWLEHVRELALDVAKTQDRVDVLRSMALPSGIDYSAPMVSTSPTADQIPNAVAKLVDAMGEYCADLAAYVDESHDAAERLKMLEDGRHRLIIMLYYVNGKTWGQVGKAANYAPDYCRHIRDEALPLVYNVMPKEWKTQIPRAD